MQQLAVGWAARFSLRRRRGREQARSPAAMFDNDGCPIQCGSPSTAASPAYAMLPRSRARLVPSIKSTHLIECHGSASGAPRRGARRHARLLPCRLVFRFIGDGADTEGGDDVALALQPLLWRLACATARPAFARPSTARPSAGLDPPRRSPRPGQQCPVRDLGYSPAELEAKISAPSPIPTIWRRAGSACASRLGEQGTYRLEKRYLTGTAPSSGPMSTPPCSATSTVSLSTSSRTSLTSPSEAGGGGAARARAGARSHPGRHHDGIWKWNFQTNELFFSPRYYAMLGYEPDEFPASFEAWRDLSTPTTVTRRSP